MERKIKYFGILVVLLLALQIPLFYKISKLQLGFWIDLISYLSLACHMAIFAMVAIEIIKKELEL
jgi:hypothetical protein